MDLREDLEEIGRLAAVLFERFLPDQAAPELEAGELPGEDGELVLRIGDEYALAGPSPGSAYRAILGRCDPDDPDAGPGTVWGEIDFARSRHEAAALIVTTWLNDVMLDLLEAIDPEGVETPRAEDEDGDAIELNLD